MTDTSLLYQPEMSEPRPSGHSYELNGVRHYISAEELDCVPFSQSFGEYVHEPPIYGRQPVATKVPEERPGATHPDVSAMLALATPPTLTTPYSFYEEHIIVLYYGKVDTGDLALALGRTPTSIGNKAERLGLNTGRTGSLKGTKPMFKKIREHYLELLANMR